LVQLLRIDSLLRTQVSLGSTLVPKLQLLEVAWLQGFTLGDFRKILRAHRWQKVVAGGSVYTVEIELFDGHGIDLLDVL
jgi:hypothetical protein